MQAQKIDETIGWTPRQLADAAKKLNEIDQRVQYTDREVVVMLGDPRAHRLGDLFQLTSLVNRWRGL